MCIFYTTDDAGVCLPGRRCIHADTDPDRSRQSSVGSKGERTYVSDTAYRCSKGKTAFPASVGVNRCFLRAGPSLPGS